MMGKLLIGVLIITVIGAAGVGVYDALIPVTEPQEPLAIEAAPQPADELISTEADVTSDTAEVAIQPQNTEQLAAQPADMPQENVSQAEALNMVGTPWQGAGTITALEANGLDLALADGSTIFLELGPEAYWQTQDVLLTPGQQIQADGFFNGEQYHAATLTTETGQQIALRTVAGQPLWSGGAAGGGNSSEHSTGQQGEGQVAAEDWLTISGTVTALGNNTVTFQPADGTAPQNLQLGRPDFWQTQGVTLTVGAAVDVLGFWQGAQFQVGDIITLTGERIMLRDPNGRPLWGGPGRNGNSSGEQGQGSHGGQGQSGTGQSQQGSQGQGQGGNGQGQQGQGQGQNQASALVPAEQWETLSGNIVGVEPLRLMVQTPTDETALVNLGLEDFWTAQGHTFVIPETISIDGYWLNGQFEAGQITMFSDITTTLVIRDANGQLVYGSPVQHNQGQGNGTQGQQTSGNQGGKQYRGGRS